VPLPYFCMIIALLILIVILLWFNVFQVFKFNNKLVDYKSDLMFLMTLKHIQDLEDSTDLIENLRNRLKTNEGNLVFNIILKERGYIKYED